jgi:hypothetical protein
MRSLGSLGFAAVLAFYVLWPMYSGYEIKSSLDTQNVEGLNARVDFASVRTSLRPAVAAKVEKVVTDALRRAGTAGGVLAESLKAQVMPRIVDGVLASLVTPEMMIRIHASGKSLKEALDGMVLERASQTQGLGGFLIVPQDQPGGGGARSKLDEIAGKYGIDVGKVLGGGTAGDAAKPETTAALPAKSSEKPKYGLGNIKHFSFNGPLGLSVGIARDAAARKPELTADLTFVDGSWKLTGLAPEL